MTNKQKIAYVLLAAAVIIAVGMGIFKVKKGGKDGPVVAPAADEQKNSEIPSPKTTEIKSEVWTGTLQSSNDAKKGNLMLVTSERTIYIKTSRDFSALVDKKVNVSYEGSLDSFVLGNITEETTE